MLGRVFIWSAGTASKVQHYDYSAFGKLLAIKDQNGNDVTAAPTVAPYFTYTGREWDAESGLYYYRARYYSPEIGRFIQVDPHPGETSNPLTLSSAYIYTLNNPINLVDPRGLFGIFQAVTLGAIIGITDPFGLVSGASRFIKKHRNKIIGAALVAAGAYITIQSGGTLAPLGAAVAGAGVGIYKTDNSASLKELGKNAAIGAIIGVTIAVVPGGPLTKAAAGAAAGALSSSAFGGTTEENIEVGKQGAIAGGVAGASGSSSSGSATGGNETVCWCGGRLIPK